MTSMLRGRDLPTRGASLQQRGSLSEMYRSRMTGHDRLLLTVQVLRNSRSGARMHGVGLGGITRLADHYCLNTIFA